jgi:cytochrome c oxidase cbb3-type subunit 4
MQTYTLLREFADSWMLLLLFCIFVGMIFWVFRPGSKQLHADTANIPFRNDAGPAAPRTEDKAPAKETGK